MILEDLYKKTEYEMFDDYFKRIHKLLPSWPEEIIKEWLFRENSCIEKYFFLGFDRFEFDLVEWENEEILSKVESSAMKSVDNMGAQFFEHPTETYLKKYIKVNKTWPSPIIILENINEIKKNSWNEIRNPFHLLEGHLRLGYIRFLIKNHPEKLNKKHLLYIAKIKRA